MFNVSASAPALPAHPPFVKIEQLYIKESIGFAFWNGIQGEGSAVYTGLHHRADTPAPVLRMFGGSAVPFPFTQVSAATQSLIRLQQYLGITESFSWNHDDFVPMQIIFSQNITTHQLVDDPNAPTHKSPSLEVGGLLRVGHSFIARFRHLFVRVALVNGELASENGYDATNSMCSNALLLMLQQVQATAPMRSVTLVNPVWNDGSYTPVPTRTL